MEDHYTIDGMLRCRLGYLIFLSEQVLNFQLLFIEKTYVLEDNSVIEVCYIINSLNDLKKLIEIESKK